MQCSLGSMPARTWKKWSQTERECNIDGTANGKDRGRYQYTICFSFSVLKELKAQEDHFREQGRKKEKKLRIELFLLKGKSR
jgi:hypothetical protein